MVLLSYCFCEAALHFCAEVHTCWFLFQATGTRVLSGHACLSVPGNADRVELPGVCGPCTGDDVHRFNDNAVHCLYLIVSVGGVGLSCAGLCSYLSVCRALHLACRFVSVGVVIVATGVHCGFRFVRFADVTYFHFLLRWCFDCWWSCTSL